VLDRALEFDEWAMSLIIGIALLINLLMVIVRNGLLPNTCTQIP
jgi:hypothetical protein